MLQGNINSLLHPGTLTIITFISHEYFLKIFFAVKTSTSFALLLFLVLDMQLWVWHRVWYIQS